jgi:hypothetical protein
MTSSCQRLPSLSAKAREGTRICLSTVLKPCRCAQFHTIAIGVTDKGIALPILAHASALDGDILPVQGLYSRVVVLGLESVVHIR